MSRTIIIGDIHGCYKELLSLLDKVGPDEDDSLISVGDMVTKGPENSRVIEFFQTGRNRRAVIGNHELLLLRYYRGEDVKLEPAHEQAIREFGDRFPEHMQWISHLPPYIDLATHFVVHGGIRPGRPIESQTLTDLTEIRLVKILDKEVPWFEVYEGDKAVIFGHWVFDKPLVRKKAVGIDTGCVYGGRLTAYILPDSQLVSVPAQRAYATKG